MKKLFVIIGPTASGKSALAVTLAKKISVLGGPASGWKGAEIISADSRQVYKGLDIGTGKITKKEMRGIPHHLLDVASPKTIFTVTRYKKLAEKVINKIIKKGKLPILCGGTGFYIQAVIDDISLPSVKPNSALRKKLEKKTVEELGKILKKLDIKRYKTIDIKNPRRLIRAIEIAKTLGEVPSLKKKNRKNKFDVLQIGIKTDDSTLKKKIHARLLKRVKQGMIKEVENLHNPPTGGGLSWKRLESLGLEYRYIALYLQGKLSKEEIIKKLETQIVRYAKRQKTWFKKDKRIAWFELKDKTALIKRVRDFIK